MARGPEWLWSKGTALLLIGFAVNLVGLIGGALWLSPAEQAVESASTEITTQAGVARTIHAAESFLDTSEHLGGVLFVVPVRKDMPDDVRSTMGELFQRAVDRQHHGFRGYLAEIAPTGALDFDATLKTYEALVEAERGDFVMDTYRAVNAYEAEVSMTMVKAQGAAAMKAVTLQRTRRDAKTVAARRRLTLTFTAFAGSLIVFVATLGGRNAEPPAPTPAARALATALRTLQTREAAGEAGETGVS